MSEIVDLLMLLMKQTDEGKVKWKLQNDNLATLRQASSILEVRELVQNQIYAFGVRNLDGLTLTAENFSMQNQGFKFVQDIFQRTKRDALGVDQALKDIRESLLKL